MKLFHEYYHKSSPLYRNLFIGIEYDNILCDKIYYVFDKEYENCTWTENYNCAITLKIYNIWYLEKGKIRIEFTTYGLDNESSIRNFYTFHPWRVNEPYLKSWIKRNL